MNNIWLLEHEHKHGTDFAVHETRAGAERAAAAFIVRQLADVECAAASHLRRLAHLEDHGRLLSLWEEHAADDRISYFRITELPLRP